MLLTCTASGSTFAADEADLPASWYATGSFVAADEFDFSKVTFRFDGDTLTGSGWLSAGDRHDESAWARVDVTLAAEDYPLPGQRACFTGSAALHRTGADEQGAGLVDYDVTEQDGWEACADGGVLKGRLLGSGLSFEARQIGGDRIGALIDEARLSGTTVEPSDEPAVVTATPAPPSSPPATAAPTSPPATIAPVEPTPTPEVSAQDAARDLWFHEGDTVTRVHHLTGEILGRWDVFHPDCPTGRGSQPLAQSDGEAVWLTIVDAQWERPVLECLIRLPLDGSMGLEAYPVPTGRKPTFVNDAAVHGGDLWAVTWKKSDPQAALEYYADWSLARLDTWAGSLTKVVPRVVALAPTDAGLVVLYSTKGATDGARRPLRLGIVEPGGQAPRKIPLAADLPRTKQGTYVRPRLRLSAGNEGTVALYDEFAGRNIVVFDPASGAIIGRVGPPEGATVLGSVWPVSDGVWMSGLLEDTYDFARYVPFDGGRALEFACSAAATNCYSQVETASDAGAWLSAWPYDDAFEIDFDHVVVRRFDATGQPLAEATGEELFGSG
jgi:hypothetical protein